MGEKRGQWAPPGEPEGQGHSERFEDHPTPEELSAYQAGELTPEQSDVIQEHLAGCELCTEVLLDLHRFLDLPPEDRPREGIVDLQTEAEWRALRAKLPKSVRPARRFGAVAAVLLAVIGFSLLVLFRGSDRYQTVDPSNGYRGGLEKVAKIYLPVTLRLRPVSDRAFPRYRADLRTLAGELVQNFPRLEETSYYNVEVPLRGGDLAPGVYKIELYGIMNGTSTPVGVYPFNVVDR